MKILILEFERAASHYKPYVDSFVGLEKLADEHREEIGKLQDKAETILKTEQTLVLDEETKNRNNMELQKIQQEAMMMDRKFKAEMDQKQQDLINKSYMEIVEIIKENLDVDIVLNKNETVYFDPSLDCTDDLIETFKTMDLFTTYNDTADAK